MVSQRQICQVAFTLGAFVAGIQAATAQTSTDYRIEQGVFTQGADLSQEAGLVSTNFHITLSAVGDTAIGTSPASPSYQMAVGFVSAYPSPGAVANLQWLGDEQTLTWTPERSAGVYELYRDTLNTLPGDFGMCFDANLVTNTLIDPTTPPTGSGWFYLATVRNMLGEEGTKGQSSNGTQRANLAPCP